MADAIISAVAARIIALMEEQVRNKVNLVRGIEEELQSLSSELNTIRNVLDDAESRRFKDKNINNWLVRLEQMSSEMEDVLDEWDFAILKLKMEKVCSFIPSSCLCFKKVVIRHDIAKKIKTVKKQLDLIFKEKDRYNFLTSQPTSDPSPESWRVQSTSLIDFANVHGRDRERDILVSKLVANSDSKEELGVHILSIVGVGGLGKTTLAQLVYNDSRVKEYFEMRIWVCVSYPFEVSAIAKGIIESIGKGSSVNINQLDVLFKQVIESVSGKRFLLVLDDVWTEDYKKWEPLENSLKCGGAGSTILVTTRNERVVKMMGTRDSEICRLGFLSNEDCRLLLCRMALFGKNIQEVENFHDIGKKIADKCKGLPLAAKALGSLLRFKNSLGEWNSIVNSEIWQLEEAAEVDLFPHLLLTYNGLSPALKRCFSYCAFFPKDFEIDVERLIETWMALGYLGSNTRKASDIELRGRKYFDILAMHSLFQDFTISDVDGQIKRCKMHDIVHDFAQFLNKHGRDGRVEVALTKKTTPHFCSPSLVSHANEYRSLFSNEEYDSGFCDCLTSLRVLGITGYKHHLMSQQIGNFIHLRWLDLSDNDLSGVDLKIFCQLYKLQTLLLCSCGIREIPWEICNLIQLRHLNLTNNSYLKKLPESICDLHELQHLNVHCCTALVRLPERLTQLTGLRTLGEFNGGSGWSKLGLLKNLDLLSGSLKLCIRISSEEVVKDAREAELRKKLHIHTLKIFFSDEIDTEEESVRMNVIDALEPHANLPRLEIWYYGGSKLPGWVSSPLNALRYIRLCNFKHLSSVPPLGKLPYLEEISIEVMQVLQSVGQEFLGITTTVGGNMDISSASSSVAVATNTIAFPKLKKLDFYFCQCWKEWEDITTEEEESTAVSLMPCLTELTITLCEGLTALPHRLLHKMSSLEVLDIRRSTQLIQRYGDKHGSAWKSISRNPRLQLKL